MMLLELANPMLWVTLVCVAISLYVVELFFFWSRWSRLSELISEEGGAYTLVQELRAEIDVLSQEILMLRRQITQRKSPSEPGHELGLNSVTPITIDSRHPEMPRTHHTSPTHTTTPMHTHLAAETSASHARKEPELRRPIPPSSNRLPERPVNRQEFTAPARPTAQRPAATPAAASTAPSFPAAHVPSSHTNNASTNHLPRHSTPPQTSPHPVHQTNLFTKGIEQLHRRVVELARAGMDSATIATECQLSQTETEMILSMNGIKRIA
ncbi:MAG: hypothetical protein V4525_13850 [Pseudomonadota bacterium]